MKHCLSEKNLQKVICVRTKPAPFDEEDKELETLYSLAQTWEVEMTIVNYFLTKVLERLSKLGYNQESTLAEVFDLPQVLFVSFQSLGPEFIDAMMGKLRLPGTTLEENIIDIQERLSSYDYH